MVGTTLPRLQTQITLFFSTDHRGTAQFSFSFPQLSLNDMAALQYMSVRYVIQVQCADTVLHSTQLCCTSLSMLSNYTHFWFRSVTTTASRAATNNYCQLYFAILFWLAFLKTNFFFSESTRASPEHKPSIQPKKNGNDNFPFFHVE